MKSIKESIKDALTEYGYTCSCESSKWKVCGDTMEEPSGCVYCACLLHGIGVLPLCDIPNFEMHYDQDTGFVYSISRLPDDELGCDDPVSVAICGLDPRCVNEGFEGIVFRDLSCFWGALEIGHEERLKDLIEAKKIPFELIEEAMNNTAMWLLSPNELMRKIANEVQVAIAS